MAHVSEVAGQEGETSVGASEFLGELLKQTPRGVCTYTRK